MQIEQLMGVRRRQLGEAFTVRRFMDELDACGLIPMSLIAWELTGEAPLQLAGRGAPHTAVDEVAQGDENDGCTYHGSPPRPAWGPAGCKTNVG